MAGLFSDIATRWRLKSLKKGAVEQPLSWEKIGKVALVLDSGRSVNKSEIDQFIESLEKYVEVFYVEARNSKPTFSDWRCFTKEHFNLLKLPKQGVIDDLRKKEFDLVINAGSGESGSSVLVAAAIPARLHCSNSEKYREAQLVIKGGATTSLAGYLAEVIRYLQMIRPRKL